jgi:hypothetical protein
MKKISIGFIFTLFLLPQFSFGDTVSPLQAACTKKLDAQAVAFFQQQGQERSNFIQANKALIAKQDAIGKWKMAGGPGAPPPALTSTDLNTMAAFTAQQQAEKTAFFRQQAIDMQACLGGTTTATTTTTGT